MYKELMMESRLSPVPMLGAQRSPSPVVVRASSPTPVFFISPANSGRASPVAPAHLTPAAQKPEDVGEGVVAELNTIHLENQRLRQALLKRTENLCKANKKLIDNNIEEAVDKTSYVNAESSSMDLTGAVKYEIYKIETDHRNTLNRLAFLETRFQALKRQKRTLDEEISRLTGENKFVRRSSQETLITTTRELRLMHFGFTKWISLVVARRVHRLIPQISGASAPAIPRIAHHFALKLGIDNEEDTEYEEQMQERLERVMRWWLFRRTMAVLRTWKDQTVAQLTSKGRLRKAILRMCHLRLSRGYFKWKLSYEKTMRYRVILWKALIRITARRQVIAIDEWKDCVAQSKLNSKRMRAVRTRMMDRTMQNFMMVAKKNIRARNIEKRALMRWRMGVSARMFFAWLSVASESARQTRLLHKVTRRWRYFSLSRSFIKWQRDVENTKRLFYGSAKSSHQRMFQGLRKWGAYTRAVVRAKDLMRKAEYRWSNLAMLKGFITWFAHYEMGTRWRGKVRRSLKKWRNASLSRGFRTWSGRVDDMRVNRKVIGTCVRRWSNRAIHRGWSGWVDRMIGMRAKRATLSKVIVKWRLHAYFRAFSTWKDAKHKKQKSTLIQQRAIERMSNLFVFKAYNTWCASVSYVVSRRRKMHRYLSAWVNRSLHQSLVTWSAHVSEIVHKKNVARKMIRRWVRSTQMRGFNVWRENAWDVASRKQEARRVIGRWRHRATYDNFCGWRDYTIVAGSMHESLRRCVERSRFRMMRGSLNDWHHVAQDSTRGRNVGRRAIRVWMTHAVFRGWYTWIEDWERRARARKILSKATARMRSARIAKAWFTWVARANRIRRQAGLKSKCIARAIHRQESRALERWMDFTTTRQRLRAGLQVIVKRWCHMNVLPAYGLWRETAILRVMKRKMVAAVFQRWRNSQLFNGFNTWQQVCVRIRKVKSILVTRLATMTRRDLMVALVTWHEVAQSLAFSEKRMVKSLRYWCQRSTARAFLEWKEETRVVIRYENTMERVLRSWQKNSLVRGLNRWKSYHSNMCRNFANIDRATSKWMYGLERGGMARWKENVARRKRARHTLLKIAYRWRRVRLHSAFSFLKHKHHCRVLIDNLALNSKADRRLAFRLLLKYVQKWQRRVNEGSSTRRWWHAMTALRLRRAYHDSFVVWRTVAYTKRYFKTLHPRFRVRYAVIWWRRWTRMSTSKPAVVCARMLNRSTTQRAKADAAAALLWWSECLRQKRLHRRLLLSVVRKNMVLGFARWKVHVLTMVFIRKHMVGGQRRTMRWALFRWNRSAGATLHYRGKLGKSVRLWQAKQYSNFFSIWKSRTTSRQTVLRRITMTLQFSNARQLRAGFNTWSSNHFDLVIHRKKLQTFSRIFARNVTSANHIYARILLREWQETANGRIISRGKMIKSAKVFRQRAIYVAWNKWEMLSRQRVRIRRLLRRNQHSWDVNYSRRCYAIWSTYVVAMRRLRKVTFRMCMLKKLRGMEGWSSFHREQVLRRCYTQRMATYELARGFRAWREFANTTIDKRCTSNRVVMKWTRGSEKRAFDHWALTVYNTRAIRSRLLKTVFRSLMKRMAWCFEEMQHHCAVSKLSKRMGQRGQAVTRRSAYKEWRRTARVMNDMRWLHNCMITHKRVCVCVCGLNRHPHLIRACQLTSEQLRSRAIDRNEAKIHDYMSLDGPVVAKDDFDVRANTRLFLSGSNRARSSPPPTVADSPSLSSMASPALHGTSWTGGESQSSDTSYQTMSMLMKNRKKIGPDVRTQMLYLSPKPKPQEPSKASRPPWNSRTARNDVLADPTIRASPHQKLQYH